MVLARFWKNYKVLIVMGSGLGLVHLGWYQLKEANPLKRPRDPEVPEPGIVAFLSPSAPSAAGAKRE